MKLSDFLKQQGDTPQGKSVYQAFIDNFDENYNEKAFEKNENEKESIANAFEWAKTSEGTVFWRDLDSKWRRTNARSNDMLWLLDGKEPPQEADVEDELEERRRKEAVTPTEQTPILPIGTNQLLDTEETKELDEAAKAIDPFGYYENMGKTTKQEKQPVSLFNSTSDGYSLQAEMFKDGSILIPGAGAVSHKEETASYYLFDEVADKDSGCDQDGIDKLLDEANNIDGKNHLDIILAERGAKYGSYKAQAKCVGDIILATQEVAKTNGKQQTAEQIGSIAYLAIKIARYANGEIGDTLDDLENYIKLTRKMEQDNE